MREIAILIGEILLATWSVVLIAFAAFCYYDFRYQQRRNFVADRRLVLDHHERVQAGHARVREEGRALAALAALHECGSSYRAVHPIGRCIDDGSIVVR